MRIVTIVQADMFPSISYVYSRYRYKTCTYTYKTCTYTYIRQEQRVYEIFIFLTPLFSAYLSVLVWFI